MNNENFIYLDIAKQLKRIADALEESNKMVKDLSPIHSGLEPEEGEL